MDALISAHPIAAVIGLFLLTVSGIYTGHVLMVSSVTRQQILRNFGLTFGFLFAVQMIGVFITNSLT